MAYSGVNVMASLRSQDQGSKSDSSGAVDIEKESAFVDEIILKNGTPAELLRVYYENFSKEYWSFTEKEKQRIKASVLLSESDRVDFAQNHFKGISLTSEILNKYQKNGETSRLLRNRGNELYKQKNLDVALHYYNLALLFAEPDSEAAGMAYANRSAVLVELNCFEDALLDVESALENNYPASMSHKLEQRRAKCRVSIEQKHKEYDSIEPKLRKQVEKEGKKMKKMRDEMSRLQKPNPLIPAAADSVEIKFDPQQGRHLVVNQDVAAGTVLAVENPYTFTLENHSKWNLGHCHHCLKRIRRGIPCPNCVFAIYCDESCQSRAAIHHFECKCLASFHASCAADQVLMAVRIILKVGPQELFRLFETKDPSYFNPKQPYGTEPDCKYESQSYLSIYHLVTNSEKIPLGQRVGTAGRAVMMTETIDIQTTFFEDIPADIKTEFKKFVAGLMLRHIEATKFNAVYVSEVEGLEYVSLEDLHGGKISPENMPDLINPNYGKFAGGLYSVFSLLNHSCDPSVHSLHNTADGTIIVVATRSLKKGENLLTSYITGIHEDNFLIRQAKLYRSYLFHCHCVACKEGWPTQSELCRQMPKTCCPVCSSTFFGYEKGSREFRKCVLNWMQRGAPVKVTKCDRCGKSFDVLELVELYREKLEQVTLQTPQLMRVGRPRKAFYEYLKLVEYFQYDVPPPNLHLYFIQEQLIRALSLVYYFAK